MKTSRRSFFSLIAGSIAAAHSSIKISEKITPSPASGDLVDYLMYNCARGTGFFRVGTWKVMWTGWKTSVESIDVAGQWVAGPLKRDGTVDWDRFGGALYSCGSHAGIYHRGDCFNLSWTFPTMCYGIDGIDANKPPNQTIDEYLEPERRVMCRLLTEWMKAGGQPTWESMSPETRFYTNCDRFIKELTGEKLDLDQGGDTAKKLSRELLHFPYPA